MLFGNFLKPKTLGNLLGKHKKTVLVQNESREHRVW